MVIIKLLGGLGLFIYGMKLMGDGLENAAGEGLKKILEKVTKNPIIAVIVGAIVTAVIQSSSATTVMVVGFVNAGLMNLAQAAGIIMGANIGTTITALLACIGQSKDAKRTAVAHCIFNISGSLLFIWFVKPYASLIQWISPKGPEVEVISRQIANAHTGFNLTMTIIWIPLVWLMVKIVMKIIPESNKKMVDTSGVLYLDNKLLAQPAAALNLVAKEIIHCSEVVREMLQNTAKLAKKEDKELLKIITEQAEKEQKLNVRITEYLAELFAGGGLTEEQATQTAGIMYVLSDIDRMASLCVDVMHSIQDKMEKKYKYSKEAMKELEKSLSLMEGMFSEAITIMSTGNTENAKKIIKKKDTVLDLDIKMRKAHMERVAKGKCAGDLTAPFNGILHSIDRMGNSCVNIADAALGRVDFKYFISLDDVATIEEVEEKK